VSAPHKRVVYCRRCVEYVEVPEVWCSADCTGAACATVPGCPRCEWGHGPECSCLGCWRDGRCGRCGGPGAAGAPGLCRDCFEGVDTEEVTR
jgi:hypothetical protein